jgi:hypothetical protein
MPTDSSEPLLANHPDPRDENPEDPDGLLSPEPNKRRVTWGMGDWGDRKEDTDGLGDWFRLKWWRKRRKDEQEEEEDGDDEQDHSGGDRHGRS